MKHKLIIDADPGIGDAVAIITALLDPRLDVLGLTGTEGMVSGHQANCNLELLVNSVDVPKWPKIGWASAELLSNDEMALPLTRLNGPHGLGDMEIPCPLPHRRLDSAKVMVDLVKQYPNEITLVCLGPLTNVMMASELYPDFLIQLNKLIVLGGTLDAPGDATTTSEFNVYANPEAARFVLKSSATKILIPLEVQHKVSLTFSEFDRIQFDEKLPAHRLLSNLLSYALKSHRQYLGEEGIHLRELTPLAYMVRPDLFTTEGMAIDIETQGEITRGMTIFDRRSKRLWPINIAIATKVDAVGVRDYFSNVLSGRVLS